MRVRPPAEVGKPGDDFPWGAVIKSEVESWHPQRPPDRFQPRAKGWRDARRRPASPGRAVRPLAAALAVVLAGALVRMLVPAHAGVPGPFGAQGGTRLAPGQPTAPIAATDQPAQRQTVVPVQAQGPITPLPRATATPSRQTGAVNDAPAVTQTTPAGIPQPTPARASTSIPTAPVLATAAAQTPVPTSKPSPSPSPFCLLNLICL